MLADNIKKYRKQNDMSQDELAEKLGVSRQSISLWENSQTQPTIDNIIALSKIFNVSSDSLLGTVVDEEPEQSVSSGSLDGATEVKSIKPKKKISVLIAIFACVIIVMIVAVRAIFYILENKDSDTVNSDFGGAIQVDEDISRANSEPISTSEPIVTSAPETTTEPITTTQEPATSATSKSTTVSTTQTELTTTASKVTTTKATTTEAEEIEEIIDDRADFDLFEYCRDFAIQVGNLYGDYCIYQQPSTRYGGYDNEYFSISFWNDSNMVEFCLHCPLSETQSINFYLRMRGGYNGKYEYLTSKYYRDTGSSFRSATGYIDPSVFSTKYPISCDSYDGSLDGQTEFMEESRVGICDLIYCLKNFIAVENMDCNFSDFGFVNF